jgi:tetratricopeptide (TPR) repeat protein
MSLGRLTAAVCLTAGWSFAQFSDGCFARPHGVIPPASVGHLCEGRSVVDSLPASPASPQPAAGAVSLHQLAHQVPGKARQAYSSAQRAKAEGRLSAAVELYQRALALDPSYLEAWNNLASTYISAGDLAAAEAALGRAYTLDRHAHPVLLNLAFVQLRLGRPDQAESFARRAIQADPLAPKGPFLLGLSLAGQHKDREEAIRLLEKSASAVPRAHFALGPLLAEANRLPDAVRHLEAYLRHDRQPDRELAQQWLETVRAELRRRQ